MGKPHQVKISNTVFIRLQIAHMDRPQRSQFKNYATRSNEQFVWIDPKRVVSACDVLNLDISYFWLIASCFWTNNCFTWFEVSVKCTQKPQRLHCHFLNMEEVSIIKENFKGCQWNLPYDFYGSVKSLRWNKKKFYFLSAFSFSIVLKKLTFNLSSTYILVSWT